MPTDMAFAELGQAVNEFLFDNKAGDRYLRALLRLHAVSGHTLYSNAYYGPNRPISHGNKEVKTSTPIDDKKDGNKPSVVLESADDKRKPTFPRGYKSWDFPTLLGEKLTVEVFSYGAMIAMRINDILEFPVINHFADDGVVHLIERILLPTELLKGD